jgi:hypothetical protein
MEPVGAGLPWRPLTAQLGRSTAGAPQAPGGPDTAPVKPGSSAGSRRGPVPGGLSAGWVPWMAEVLASARGRWWDMMLLLDQLGGIWEIILAAAVLQAARLAQGPDHDALLLTRVIAAAHRPGRLLAPHRLRED